jgi:hypothetical protein
MPLSFTDTPNFIGPVSVQKSPALIRHLTNLGGAITGINVSQVFNLNRIHGQFLIIKKKDGLGSRV